MLFARKLPTDERGDLEVLDRKQMRIDLDKMNVSRALRHNVPSETDFHHDICDKVPISCKKGLTKRNGDYLSQLKVASFHRSTKLVHIYKQPSNKSGAYRFCRQVTLLQRCSLLYAMDSGTSDHQTHKMVSSLL